ncbi:Leucine-rich PPR motif-containing protein, mitochondrial [Camponotus floridanus]|uniref:Leucine-rich PPR motif-containing protein, mitochondrial n=1 Tax=Camponotus floridanus TaxID=104421 RepID=E2AXP3_CAMFO|nr:leucine-rich PPR motif-containing protein, mitochondrial [Camponotus floridanus]EFN61789.1 Leucine-rich PPR motif-containing protein, mitochondrial [Camponotus floridanus]
MIETDKMLQLRRYMTLLRAGAKSRVVHSHLHTSSSPREIPSLVTCEGYVSRYVHHGLSRLQVHLRKLPCESYTATCIRTFSTTVPQTSIEDIDHKLMTLCDDIKRGQVSADNLKEVIKLCEETDYQLQHDTGMLLLKCCGNLLSNLETTERQYLTDQVWRLAKKSSEGLTLEYYNTLLNVHMENSNSVEPKQFLVDMNVEPDKNTYHLLLSAVAKMGNSNHLQDIISVMKEKNVIIDEDTFNGLVEIYVTNDNIAQAEHVIKLMQDAKLSTNKAYTELAYGYAKLGDIPNLVKILNDEPQSNTNLLKLIEVLSTSNNSRHIPVVLNFLMTSVPTIKLQISKTITNLIRADRVADAHMIINCFVMNDTTKDVAKSFVNSFLNELIMLNPSVDEITRYTIDFVNSGCEPLALINVAESGLKLGRENLCLAIFKAMREKGIEVRPHYYWPLLAVAHYNHGEAKILSLVKYMVDTGVTPDFDTLLNYVFPYVNTANPSITLQKLLINGVPGSVVYTPLIFFLLSHNRMQDIKTLCTRSKSYRIYYKEIMKPLVRAYIATKDVETCVLLLTMSPLGQNFIGWFLKMLLNNKQLTYTVEDLHVFLEAFKKCGAKIPQCDATVLKNTLLNENFKFTENANIIKLIDNLGNINLKESALSLFTPPKCMNPNELACHLVELKNKNMPIRNTLRLLLEIHCIENNLKKVEEIKQEWDRCGYELTPGMKMQLFELYVRCDKLRDAEIMLSNLDTSNFLIDNVKIIKFATALVKANKLKKAFEIINKIDNVNLKTDAKKQCHLLLQTLAGSEYDSYTKDMLNLLIQKGYCEITTELLRPIVAISLKHNDIQGAVDIFITCATKFKKTPLALELLTELLKQKDSSKLLDTEINIKKIYNTLVMLTSVDAANTMLVLALATLDKTQEIQTILQNQRISSVTLLHYFKYAQRIRNVDCLLKLLKAIPSSNEMDQSLLSEMLLSIYSKIGDCNNAIELWKLMCAKNIKPSEQFKNNFTQFLQANKVPLPLEFEQDKSEINVNN